jgi:molybdopterin-containing oxidoreductase family iron-sulfur binding subunit
MSNDRHINFKILRDRILREPSADGEGKQYWRNLEELADSPAFEELVRREFPQQAEEWDDPVERRTFLKIMGASLALAGLSGCVIQPPEKIIPYVRQPEEETPGRGLWFATAFSLGGVATPVLVRSNEGRPTKIDGNPDHPSSNGSTATDIFAQASILTLYDPDRSQTPLYRGETRPWAAFVAELRGAIDKENDGFKAKKGAGLRILTETVTSPTLAAQLKQFLTDFPEAKWHQYEPVNRDNARAGAVSAFSQPVNTTYDFSKADRILSIGSDFLSAMPGTLRYARDYAAKRRISGEQAEMNRLYVIESTPTITGANADHRLSIAPSRIPEWADRLNLLMALTSFDDSHVRISGKDYENLLGIAKDFVSHKGSSIVIVGDEQPPEVHAAAHSMNAALGNVGKTVFYSDPIEANSVDQTQSLRELVGDIDAGKVDTLIIIGGNPAYNTPIDLRLDFNRLDKKVRFRAHLSLYNNETSDICHWHIPAAHYLESWSDARTIDGTATIVQPLIAPLYEGKTAHEIIALFSDNYDRKPYDIVKEYWRSQPSGPAVSSGPSRVNTPSVSPTPSNARNGLSTGSGSDRVAPAAVPSPSPTPNASTDFESSWRKWLHDGYIPNTQSTAKTFAPKFNAASSPAQNTGETPAPPATGNQYEVIFRADPTIYDGRFANNGWLQELPKPLTKITWDNVAMVSAATAAKIGVTAQNYEEGKHGREAYVDVVRLSHGDRKVIKEVPVWVMPGQPDDVITVHLGYGRTVAGRVGSGPGFSAYDIRQSSTPWNLTGVGVEKTNARFLLATTQAHFQMEDRDVLRESTLEEYQKEKDHLREEREEQQKELRELSLYPGFDYKNQGHGYAWGMSIDLNSCVGCNACMIACQSENNIPIVGKEQVARSREMHWIRVDAYFKGDEHKPEGPFFQPVPCMHCENAPCEPVCPVHATVHSAEGLNDMVYNRCVGTKYCSNNCPYKVRRFNFFLYQDWEAPTYQLMRNPDVSVRSRGVMEKCTYCVQRIQAAKIQSEIEGREVRDGEIVTACQSVCPTEAIVFGNINDPNSKVSKLKALERDYSLLGELNTRPRTTYLSALRNPNPEIKG